MTEVDVVRMTEAGVAVDHVPATCALETDGPWLIVHDGAVGDGLRLLVPASAVVAAVPCEGRCGAGAVT